MAKSLNQVFVMGNLTRDPELKTIPSGTSVCQFSIAVNRSWTGLDGQSQDSVDYFDIVAWGKLGELVSQYMAKGRKCLVQGRLQQQTWDAKDGGKRSKVEIVAEDVTFLDGGGGNSGNSNYQAPGGDSTPADKPAPKKSKDVAPDDIDENEPIDLSEIPF